MISNATQIFGLLSLLITEREDEICFMERFYICALLPVKCIKTTFLWDFGSLAQNDFISKDMGFESMSKTVGILTSIIFGPETQHL